MCHGHVSENGPMGDKTPEVSAQKNLATRRRVPFNLIMETRLFKMKTQLS